MYQFIPKFEEPILVKENVSSLLLPEQIDACNIIGALEVKSTNNFMMDAEPISRYRDLILPLTTTMFLLTQEEQENFSQSNFERAAELRKARIIIGTQAMIYFSGVLAINFNDIFPPISPLPAQPTFRGMLDLYRSRYAQAIKMKKIDSRFDIGDFESILHHIGAKGFLGPYIYKALEDLQSEPELLKSYPHLEPAKYELIDTFRQRFTDLTIPIRKNLEIIGKNVKIENKAHYIEYLEHLLNYVNLLENIPPIDINIILKLRRSDLVTKAVITQTELHREDIDFELKDWDEYVLRSKEELLLNSMQLFTPEVLLEDLAGLEGIGPYKTARKYITLIYETFERKPDRLNKLYLMIVDGLHRIGRTPKEVIKIINGLLLHVPDHEKDVLVSNLKEKIPDLIKDDYLDPKVIPDELKRDFAILIASSLKDSNLSLENTRILTEMISELPLVERINLISKLAKSSKYVRNANWKGLMFNDILWSTISISDKKILREYITQSLKTVDKNLIVEISDILQNQKIFPTIEVRLEKDSYDPYIKNTETTYQYISALIVGCIYRDPLAKKDLRAIYRKIKQSNPELATLIQEYSKEVGIVID